MQIGFDHPSFVRSTLAFNGGQRSYSSSSTCGRLFIAVFTLSAMTNEDKSQTKRVLAGL